jgi:hypothetical protein
LLYFPVVKKPETANEVIPIQSTTRFTTGGEYDLYFTLKYIAYDGGAISQRSEPHSYTCWTARKAEVAAYHAIDALLRAPLPEVVLWWERKRIEDKLFGPQRPYSPFL